ncbi:MAG: N-acetylmuramoyl-L-alanine amidase, partial [Rhodothermales bacterium]|nr:N-acetylmuramoyl-L-alanine amidase [Rhodothermales bacterium]
LRYSLLVFLLATLSVRAEAGGAELARVSFADRSDGRGQVVRLHTTARPQAYRVETEAGTIRLTLFQTQLRGQVQRDEPGGPVRDYSLATVEGRTVLTLHLQPGVEVEASAYPDRDRPHLLLSLTYAAGSGPVAAAGANTNWALDCIVIDAGHGGHDGGAAAHGIREKDVVLGVARKLGRYVEDRLGVRVVYTREDDRFIELHERGRIANESCGKLFVSIHANAAGSGRAYGAETYFLGLHRSESARQVMERENSVVALEGDPDLYAGMDDSALILQTMAESTYQRTSEQLAGLIQSQFTERAGRHGRGVKQAGFLVLWRASMPAVLVELGFVTNREEARFLASERGQDLLASAIFRAIRDYKEQYERGLGLASF